MTAPISANANVQQQPQVQQQYCELPDFRPSYNAVQLNMSQPTLNAPAAMPPLPATATQQWQA